MKKVIILLFILISLTGCGKNNDNSNKDEGKVKDSTQEEVSLENDEINMENKNQEGNINFEETNNELEQAEEVENTNTDNINNDNYVDNNSNNNNTTDELVDTSNIETEEDVVNYFVELKDKIKEKLNKETWENAKESVMKSLNTAYGFCFKGEEIGGYTLSELSQSAKEKILNIVFDIDEFIESKSPGYKDSFKESYHNMIENAKESLGLIKDKIKEIFKKDEE